MKENGAQAQNTSENTGLAGDDDVSFPSEEDASEEDEATAEETTAEEEADEDEDGGVAQGEGDSPGPSSKAPRPNDALPGGAFDGSETAPEKQKGTDEMNREATEEEDAGKSGSPAANGEQEANAEEESSGNSEPQAAKEEKADNEPEASGDAAASEATASEATANEATASETTGGPAGEESEDVSSQGDNQEAEAPAADQSSDPHSTNDATDEEAHEHGLASVVLEEYPAGVRQLIGREQGDGLDSSAAAVAFPREEDKALRRLQQLLQVADREDLFADALEEMVGRIHDEYRSFIEEDFENLSPGGQIRLIRDLGAAIATAMHQYDEGLQRSQALWDEQQEKFEAHEEKFEELNVTFEEVLESVRGKDVDFETELAGVIDEVKAKCLHLVSDLRDHFETMEEESGKVFNLRWQWWAKLEGRMQRIMNMTAQEQANVKQAANQNIAAVKEMRSEHQKALNEMELKHQKALGRIKSTMLYYAFGGTLGGVLLAKLIDVFILTPG